jgi:diguanylate cyclase (GGDEF)-like protein
LWGRPLVAVLVCYLAANAVVTATWGPQGRHVLLNLSLGATYALMAVAAALESRRVDASLRPALRLLALLMGLLALLTTARGLLIAWQGTEVLYRGWAAQLYYAYAAVAASLLGPNLLWMVFLRLNRQLAELASRDALTRALNRNGLDDALRHHFGTRPSAPVTWLQVDVDHFKRINDEHGHAAGDEVLKHLARAIAEAIRPYDRLARYGGEEFVAVLPNATLTEACQIAERVRVAVAETSMPLRNGTVLRVTVSVGVSERYPDDHRGTAMFDRADSSLYRAKGAGRNRWVA